MLAFLFWLFKDALFFFGIVSGRGSFPRPLSRQEEQETIAAMKAGDENARLKLIEHNLRLVSHIARKYTVPGYTLEDLVSVGSLGLIKAVNTFKPDAGPSFLPMPPDALKMLSHRRCVLRGQENGFFQ